MTRIVTLGIFAVVLFLAQPLQAQKQDSEDHQNSAMPCKEMDTMRMSDDSTESGDQNMMGHDMSEMCMKMCMNMMHGNMMDGGMDMDMDMMDMDMDMNPDIGEVPDLRSDISDDFREEFTGLIGIYLSLKDALVESDLQTATNLAAEAEQQLEAIGEDRLQGDAQDNWRQTRNNLMEHLEPMTASGDLDELRTHFREVSGNLAEAAKSFGIEGVVYHQYCPMEEASWLSSEEEIQNPYMPEMMPGCGEVIERIE